MRPACEYDLTADRRDACPTGETRGRAARVFEWPGEPNETPGWNKIRPGALHCARFRYFARPRYSTSSSEVAGSFVSPLNSQNIAPPRPWALM